MAFGSQTLGRTVPSLDRGTGVLLCTVAASLACRESTETAQSSCSDEPGTICTWAGTGDAGFNGDGLALTASWMSWLVDITFASSGKTYVLDWNNHAGPRGDGRRDLPHRDR